MTGKPKFRGVRKLSDYRRGELATDVLRVIGAGLLISGAVMAPNMAQVIDYFDPKGIKERRRMWRAIKYLEEKDSVRVVRENGADILYVTDGGRFELEDQRIAELQVEKPWRWDHRWRLVMFDVPSAEAAARNALRAKLRDIGFVQYQKSVFIFPYECQKEILAVAEYFGVHRHIRYVVADEISDIRRFARKFDLL